MSTAFRSRAASTTWLVDSTTYARRHVTLRLLSARGSEEQVVSDDFTSLPTPFGDSQ